LAILIVAPLFAFALAVIVSRRLDAWSLATGAALSVGIALLMFILGEPPQHIQKWRRGAEGERKTEKALKPLERQDWTVDHDVQRDGRGPTSTTSSPAPLACSCWRQRTSPARSASSQEFSSPASSTTKTRSSGTTAWRRACKGRPRNYRLASTPRPDAEPGCMIWGRFPAGQVTHENVNYIHGGKLAAPPNF
jgi:hypothetical protein